MVELSNSDGAIRTTTDNGTGDFDFFFGPGVTTGLIVTGGSLGAFDTNVETGAASPYLGNGFTYEMDLASSNTTSGAGDITIKLTDTDISFTRLPFWIEFGGTSNGTISFQTYIDSTNTAFGTETLLSSTDIMSGDFSGSDQGQITLTAPYSMTIVATISHLNKGDITSFDYNIKVAEPMPLALVGLGLLGLTLVSRRRSRK